MVEEKTEKKVRSIRADDETFNRFKALCDELGGQSECLNSLITAYEVAAARNSVPEQAANIDEFRAHAEALTRSYLNILEQNTNAEERARLSFAAQLESKDKIIFSFQAETEEQKARAGRMIETISELEQKAENERAEHERTAAALSQAEELNKLQKAQIETISERYNELKEKAAKIEEEKEKAIAAAERLPELLEQIRNNEKEINELKEQATRAEKEKELQLRAARLEVKEEYQNRAEEQQNAHKQEIKEMTAEHKATIEELKAEHKEIIEQLKAEHKKELSRLQEQLQQLQNTK